MIIQNISEEGHTDISFTVTTEHLTDAMAEVNKVNEEIKAEKVSADASISKISIVGAGMRSHSGIAARMFETLSRENINILMISTSEIKVSCLIDEKYTEQATRTLHEAFDLKTAPVNNSEGSSLDSKIKVS